MAPLPSPTQENQSVLVLNPSIRSPSHGYASHVTAVRGETGTHPPTPSTPLTEVSRPGVQVELEMGPDEGQQEISRAQSTSNLPNRARLRHHPKSCPRAQVEYPQAET